MKLDKYISLTPVSVLIRAETSPPKSDSFDSRVGLRLQKVTAGKGNVVFNFGSIDV